MEAIESERFADVSVRELLFDERDESDGLGVWVDVYGRDCIVATMTAEIVDGMVDAGVSEESAACAADRTVAAVIGAAESDTQAEGSSDEPPEAQPDMTEIMSAMSECLTDDELSLIFGPDMSIPAPEPAAATDRGNGAPAAGSELAAASSSHDADVGTQQSGADAVAASFLDEGGRGGEVDSPSFTAVAAGVAHTCAVRTDGAPECWGFDRDGQSSPPDGSFVAVAVGEDHSCALLAGGSIECWGSNEHGQAEPPPGDFSAIAAGDFHTCGLRADGTAQCWGADGMAGRATPPPGQFSAISAGLYHTCGLHLDGEAQCWGADNYGQATPPGQFSAISAGDFHTCGLRADGTAQCWGENRRHGQATAPRDRFSAIAAGGEHTCGLRADGTARCWGNDSFGAATPPSGEFTAITSGHAHSCGLSADGGVRCWGWNQQGQADPQRAGVGC